MLPGTLNVTDAPTTGVLFVLTTAQILDEASPTVPLAVPGVPAVTVEPTGNCTAPVNVTPATLFGFVVKPAVILWPVSDAPSVQLVVACPLVPVVEFPPATVPPVGVNVIA
jgi:hypothetical protein